MTQPPRLSRLVAHRGYPAYYPENSLVGIAAALRAGACAVEFDVQLSADGTPVVLHDADLSRTAGEARCVLDCDWPALSGVSVHEPARFGAADPQPLPRLAEVVDLLRDWPEAQVFVELKTESVERFGAVRMVNAVLDVLQPIALRCVLISFAAAAVHAARRAGCVTGWVLRETGEATLAEARALQPDVLIVNHKRMPRPLWPGPWHWMLYAVNDPAQALLLADSGAAFIETDAIGVLLREPSWRMGSCHAR